MCVFDQVMPIITKTLNLKIAKFIKQDLKTKLEYYTVVNELKNFKILCQQIPLKVSFPMFVINCIEVKEKLIERVEELIQKVFLDLEKETLQKSNQIDKKHTDI